MPTFVQRADDATVQSSSGLDGVEIVLREQGADIPKSRVIPQIHG
jgi:hypothetical protein